MIATLKEWVAKAIAFIEKIMGWLRVKLSFAQSISPTFAPNSWLAINVFWWMTTAVFFVMGCLPEDEEGLWIAERSYKLYNLAVCLVWIWESTLWMIFDKDDPVLPKMCDFLLACYFIPDAIIWLLLDDPVLARDIRFYSGIDFVVYTYFVVNACQRLLEAEDTDFSNRESEDDVESGVKQPALVVKKEGVDKDLTEEDLHQLLAQTEPDYTHSNLEIISGCLF